MKNIVKRIAAIGAAVMMMSSMAIGASAYTLRFTSGAPSKDNIMTATTTVKATSAGKITVKSTTFAVSVSGAYTQMECTSHTTNISNVNSVGTYYMNYKGTAVPKAGTPVTVKATLTNYVVSKTVSSKGTITAQKYNAIPHNTVKQSLCGIALYYKKSKEQQNEATFKNNKYDFMPVAVILVILCRDT